MQPRRSAIARLVTIEPRVSGPLSVLFWDPHKNGHQADAVFAARVLALLELRSWTWSLALGASLLELELLLLELRSWS